MNDTDIPNEYRYQMESKIIRAEQRDADTFTLEALAAVTNKWTDIYDIRERIAPGAFREAIPRSDVVFNIDHEGHPLARSTAGTLRLKETDDGLVMSADLDRANPRTAELESMIRRGDMDAFSFAFIAGPEDQDWKGTDRTLTAFRSLVDVSLVARPAYEGTKVLSARNEVAAEIAKRSRDSHRLETDIKRSMIARQLLRGMR